MKFRRVFHFLCILWWFVLTLMIDTQYNSSVARANGGRPPLLLLISFDGFRWDYLNMYKLKNFEYLRCAGSHADFIHNSFSTITFPNHWTMVTGLFEESHGIVQNHMYDPTLNKTFHYTSPETQTLEWFGQNKLAEPIWATNQRGGEGRRSAAEWIGANVVFNNQSILNIPFNRSTHYKDLMDRFVDLFVDADEPINFGAIYFDEPGNIPELFF
jgi:ectonucleotide pyrophosphatase/phosphodiesterase family protein 5